MSNAYVTFQRDFNLHWQAHLRSSVSAVLATTQSASGRSPFDVQRQLGHTSLKMSNHYASLTIQQLHKSHEQHSPLRAKGDKKDEAFGSGYWNED